MLSRDMPKETIKQWQDAYAALQTTDFFEKTSNEWSDILGYEVGYSKIKGYFVK